MLNKSTNRIIIFLLIIFSTVIGSYILNFYSFDISSKPENWGQLGDYIGGILNPALSFTTVIILIATIKIQGKQLDSSREELALTREELRQTARAATKQAEHFERESKLKEHLVLIEKLASRINRNFNENKLDGERSLHGFVTANSTNIPSDYIHTVLHYYNNEQGSKTKRTVSWVESDLIRLSKLIQNYEKISSDGTKKINEPSPIPQFYQAEFGEMASVLLSHEMLDTSLESFFRPNS
ncbi:hypothetical protein AX279_21525 [Pseudomonas sp. J237]|nr:MULTISPECIES: hypothetical protein [Pseudomonas]OEO23698.1 hypothetical protein AX279_21525 [Pseudomonas sp. J237]